MLHLYQTFHIINTFLLDNFIVTNNNGYCCTSDNVYHGGCVITNGYSNDFDAFPLPGLEPNFEMSQCHLRCMNDPLCKGFSIITVNWTFLSNPYLQNTSFDTCNLATSSNASLYCSHNQPSNPTSSPTAIGPIDPNAACTEQTDSPGQTIDYKQGCHIKFFGNQGMSSLFFDSFKT